MKKTSLRGKSERRAQLVSKISEFKQQHSSFEQHGSLPSISQATKKQKQQEKSDKFITQLVNKVTFNTSGGISKSSLRRQKRKAKEQLKPKMDEILDNLPKTSNDVEIKSLDNAMGNDFVESNRINRNKPNPVKASGYKRIMKEENRNFSNVLKNPQFRASPFEALKLAIQENRK
ncbi:SLX9 [Candida oxycetoniae]|uniref:Ribosome biogenesis protein SLX9 n=1 Tax=Candida oxycetoniae TaxID=497107 RepID=A0AAI9WZP5_9ASCO|nr:SLX9 [Candida oxycetoniae]KAI3406279.2 SLX9 [Candida oxycetoniae]